LFNKIASYTNTDQFIKLLLGICIIIHFAVFILAFTSKRFLQFAALLNGIMAFCISFYWINRQVRYGQIDFPSKEFLLVIVEVALLLVCIYTLIRHADYQWIRVIQYIFFGFHLIGVIFFSCFMLFFKMNRLF